MWTAARRNPAHRSLAHSFSPYGTEEQKKKYLKFRWLGGEKIGAGLTEHQRRTDAYAARSIHGAG